MKPLIAPAKLRSLLLAASLAALGSAGAGCVVHAATPVEVEYEPMEYEGAVVYYDDDGVPIVFVNDEVRYVPRTYVHYEILVRNYHHHRPGYHHWEKRHPRRGVPVPRHRR